MPLPVTKGQLNRLGDRLITAGGPSEADFDDLAVVLASYQEVLERVKANLHDLGFAPSGRVKTTKTITDKLLRTRGMELSRMQDLAGARIVVNDLEAQDEANEEISGFYGEQGCSCREIDRRKDPRFGYKAVHLVVRVDEMPVEIQIRTELQDTWAQIVERLADRWGRGIRYGEDPEDPEAVVRSGDLVTSRREAMALLMRLSDTISAVEQLRREVVAEQLRLRRLGAMLGDPLYSRADPQRLTNKIPPEMVRVQSRMASTLAEYVQELDEEGRQLLEAGVEITGAQLVRMVEITHGLYSKENSRSAGRLQSSEESLRGILQLIAGATDEGA